MRKQDLYFRFRVESTDEWGNDFLYCPICQHVFKHDGIVKHMVVQSKFNTKYAAFLKERSKKPKPVYRRYRGNS